MSSQTKTSGNGIGFLGLLAIVFITLKLCNVINWSWWWVTSPLWGGVAVHFCHYCNFIACTCNCNHSEKYD